MRVMAWTIGIGLLLLLDCAAAQQYLGKYSANPYDPNSTANPYGAGNPYRPDSPNNPYGTGWTIIGE